MVKHAQTILPQKPTNCMSVLDHFMGLALKGLSLLGRTLLWHHISEIVFEEGFVARFK